MISLSTINLYENSKKRNWISNIRLIREVNLMIEFSAPPMLAFVKRTNTVISENKRGLTINAQMLTRFLRIKVFNTTLKNHYGVILKSSPWAIQF
jgi:hypothetical protein